MALGKEKISKLQLQGVINVKDYWMISAFVSSLVNSLYTSVGTWGLGVDESAGGESDIS